MSGPSRNVSSLLTITASRYPGRTAIVFGAERITYAQLDAASNQVANLLVERGIRPGDKVAISCPNIPHFTTIYFGILKAGAVVVPLNVLLKAREVAYHLKDSDAMAYFAYEGSPELPMGREAWSGLQLADRGCAVLPHRQRRLCGRLTPDQLLCRRDRRAARDIREPSSVPTTTRRSSSIRLGPLDSRRVQSSGTGTSTRTSAPAPQLFEADPATSDVYLCVLPLFHSFGQVVIQNGAIAFGGTLVLQPRFSAPRSPRAHARP